MTDKVSVPVALFPFVSLFLSLYILKEEFLGKRCWVTTPWPPFSWHSFAVDAVIDERGSSSLGLEGRREECMTFSSSLLRKLLLRTDQISLPLLCARSQHRYVLCYR